MKTKRMIQFLMGAALLAFLTGCEEEERYKLRFSHNLHVEEMEMDCSDCHGDLGEPSFKVISHDTCIDCHEEPEAEEIGPDTCGICHQEKQVALYADAEALAEEEMPEDREAQAEEEETALPERSVFVHTEALAGKCIDCHGNLMDEELESVPLLVRDEVLAIREAAHRTAQDCTTCHVDLYPNVAPASHDVAWTKRHGHYFMQDDASCSVCHTQDSCTDCHSVMQPVSHNNLFRMQTHGAMAAWNREGCMVCHVEDSCTSCHATTRPRSHKSARWGSGFRPTHCIGCHNTSTPGDGCTTCHVGGNDIMLHEQYWGGAAIDHNQPGIENCYQCHWTQTP